MGNEGGLSAEQLFDMMELWNCLGVLLQGFQGRTADARKFGIYEDTDVRGGDIDGEELMLGKSASNRIELNANGEQMSGVTTFSATVSLLYSSLPALAARTAESPLHWPMLEA